MQTDKSSKFSIFIIDHSGIESYGGAVIEWQPVIDSLGQSVIVFATLFITMDNCCNIFYEI